MVEDENLFLGGGRGEKISFLRGVGTTNRI